MCGVDARSRVPHGREGPTGAQHAALGAGRHRSGRESHAPPGARGTARLTVRQRLAPLAVALVLLAGAGLLVQALGLRVNFTASLPRGLYRVVPGAPARGTIALVCLAERDAAWALARGYVLRGDECPAGQDRAGRPVRVAPLGKVVLATAGDTVDLAPAGLVRNGRPVPRSGIARADSRGRPLTAAPGREAPGRYVLRAGELWLWSPYHPLSFDSRYVGPVRPVGAVTRVVPVWTIGQTKGGGADVAAWGERPETTAR